MSLDTLRPERFRDLTRSDELDRVLEGIDAAAPLFPGLKIDTVVIRGVNDDELIELMEFGATHGAEVRFIEYMDVGGATHWSMSRVVSRREMLERLEATLRADHAAGRTVVGAGRSLPAARRHGVRHHLVNHRAVLQACDRSRLTADGLWYLCLYARHGTDLRRPLRAGASADELAALIRATWEARSDRGAEERLAGRDRVAADSAGSAEDGIRTSRCTRGADRS